LLNNVPVPVPGVRVESCGVGVSSVVGEEGGVQKEGVEPPGSSSTGSGVESSELQSWPTWRITNGDDKERLHKFGRNSV
jgi:hypothetical protein